MSCQESSSLLATTACAYQGLLRLAYSIMTDDPSGSNRSEYSSIRVDTPSDDLVYSILHWIFQLIILSSTIQWSSCRRLLLPILPTISPSLFLLLPISESSLLLEPVLSNILWLRPLQRRLRSPRLQLLPLFRLLLLFPIRFHWPFQHWTQVLRSPLFLPDWTFLWKLLKPPTDCFGLPLRSSQRLLQPRLLPPLQLIHTLWSQGRTQLISRVRTLVPIILIPIILIPIRDRLLPRLPLIFATLELLHWPSFTPDPLLNWSISLWIPLKSIGYTGSHFQGWPLLSLTSTSVAATISKLLPCSIWFHFGLLWSLPCSDPNKHTSKCGTISVEYCCGQILTSRSTHWIVGTHSWSDTPSIVDTHSCSIQVLAWVDSAPILYYPSIY